MTTSTYRSINLAATLLGIDRRLSIVILIAAFWSSATSACCQL